MNNAAVDTVVSLLVHAGEYTCFLTHSLLPYSKYIYFCFKNAFSITDKESLLTAENPGMEPEFACWQHLRMFEAQAE